MPLTNIDYILILSSEKNMIETLGRVCKRLGAKKVKDCQRQSQALATLEVNQRPELIIEDLSVIDKNLFFPSVQENYFKNHFVPIPVFALATLTMNHEIKIIQNSDYIGYIPKPINESLLEQKIRSLYYDSYSYDQANALSEIIEQHIVQGNLRAAFRELLPALARKPKNVNYLLLYASILFEKKRYDRTEEVIRFILNQEPDNLRAKNILSKILIVTQRYQEGEDLE